MKKSSQWALKAGKAGPYLKYNPELHEWLFAQNMATHLTNTHTYAAKNEEKGRKEDERQRQKEKEGGDNSFNKSSGPVAAPQGYGMD